MSWFKKQQPKVVEIQIIKTKTLTFNLDERGRPDRDLTGLVRATDSDVGPLFTHAGEPIFTWQKPDRGNRKQVLRIER